MIFYNELIIILGGKSFYSKSKGNNLLQNEIFNLKTNDGFEFPGISMIRHINFIHDKNIFLFGGMDINTSNILGNLYCISLEKLKINSKEFKEFEIIEKDKIPLNQNYFTLDNERKNKKENINNAMTNPVYENNEKHLLNKELEDEKNKNKILIEKINQLEINLKDEKNKNINLSKKLKELNNKLEIMNKNNQKLLKNKENFDNMIYEKEKEIQELKERLSRFPFELNKGEKLMSLVIISIDQKIHCSIICKNSDKFNQIENKLYEEYPEYSNFDNIFIVNGNKIIKSKSLDENKIRHNNIIILNNILKEFHINT
jgi:hypothetical protein